MPGRPVAGLTTLCARSRIPQRPVTNRFVTSAAQCCVANELPGPRYSKNTSSRLDGSTRLQLAHCAWRPVSWLTLVRWSILFSVSIRLFLSWLVVEINLQAHCELVQHF